MMITHEDISKRAREIWEREGRPEGRDKDHWLAAEAELQSETQRNQTNSNGVSEDNSVLKLPSAAQEENGARKRSVRRGK